MNRINGIVVRIFDTYGFGQTDEGESLFLHPSNYSGEWTDLQPGTEFTCVGGKSPKGQIALTIELGSVEQVDPNEL